MSNTLGTQHNPIHESVIPPATVPPANHGHTTASWTFMIIVMFAAAVSCVGLMMGSGLIAWLGLPIALVGMVIGGVLRMLGYGQVPAKKQDA